MERVIYQSEHEFLRQSVQEFVKRTLAPRQEQMLAEKCIARDIWKEAGSLGFLGLSIPEEFGGAGADDFRFNAVVAEEIAAFSLGVASCFSIHADVCPPYIVELGTEEQKRRWLPGIAAGELVCCIAMTEPSGGSDLAALKTTAVRDGENWVINGSKTFITNGYGADLIILAARTGPGEGSRGITLFVVEEGTPGFTRGRKLDKVGLDESDTSELFFDNVVVPDANRLGEVGQGFAAMMRLLTQERLATSVTNIGQAAQIFARDDPLREGPPCIRAGDRIVPAQQVHARRTGDEDRADPGVPRPVRPAAHPARTVRGGRGEAEVVVVGRSERSCG